MNKVFKAAWFFTKVGVGGGVLYFTVDQGVWGNSRQAAATYERLYDIMPGTKDVSEKYLTLPKPDAVNINFRSYWNSGVFYTFDFLASLPSKIVGLKDTVVGFVSSGDAPAKSSEETEKAEAAKPEEAEKSETVASAPEETPAQSDEKTE